MGCSPGRWSFASRPGGTLAVTHRYDPGMSVLIRPARASDLERINEIYNVYIVDSPISFDL